jgi:hypothetical protein
MGMSESALAESWEGQMSERRSDWKLVTGVVLTIAIPAALWLGSQRPAYGEDGEDEDVAGDSGESPDATSEEPEDPVGPISRVWSPFVLYAAGPDEIRYEETTTEPIARLPERRPSDGEEPTPIADDAYRAAVALTRHSVDDAGQWGHEHGADTAAVWSRHTRRQVAAAAVRRAEYEAGTGGLEDVGVR